MQNILEVLQDTAIDTLKLLPFLFITYLIMEYIEHKTSNKIRETIKKSGRFGPLFGAVAYAYCGKDIKLKCSTTFSLVFEEIPCLPYGLPGTIHIADGIEDAIKDHDLILLGNHGCIAVGKTLEDAVKIIEAAEEVLKIYHLTKEIGPVHNISDDDLEELYNNHPGSRRNRYGK